MKNWKTVVVISILANLILIILLVYKSTLKTAESTEVLRLVMKRAAKVANDNAREEYMMVQPDLERVPQLRKVYNEGIDHIRQLTSDTRDRMDYIPLRIVAEIMDSDPLGMDYGHFLEMRADNIDNRRMTKQVLFKESYADSLVIWIQDTRKETQATFKETLAGMRGKEGVMHYEIDSLILNNNELFELDEAAEIESLRFATLGECLLVLRKWQLNLALEEVHYLRLLRERLDVRKTKFDEHFVVMHSRNPVVKLGEPFEAEVAVGSFSKELAPYSHIKVNGKEYPLDEDGVAHYTVRPTRTGTHKLKLQANVTNQLSGERMTGSSEYHFEVFE